MEHYVLFRKFMAPDYPPNREWLMDSIVNKIRNLHNVFIVSHTGWGLDSFVKQSVIRLLEIDDNFLVIYVDLKHVYSPESFTKRVTESLLEFFQLKKEDIRSSKSSTDFVYKLPAYLASRSKKNY